MILGRVPFRMGQRSILGGHVDRTLHVSLLLCMHAEFSIGNHRIFPMERDFSIVVCHAIDALHCSTHPACNISMQGPGIR